MRRNGRRCSRPARTASVRWSWRISTAIRSSLTAWSCQNRDGAFGVNKDGKFFVWIRYDLPESMNSLVLVPNGSGIDYKAKIAAGETPTHENEDIVLLK